MSVGNWDYRGITGLQNSIPSKNVVIQETMNEKDSYTR